MHEEGIFRLSGSAKEIETIRKKLDLGSPVSFSGLSVHSVSGLTKLWIRKLPEPLLTFQLYDGFCGIQGKFLGEKCLIDVVLGLSDEKERLNTIKDLVNQLPMYNKFVLQHLIHFLKLISFNSESNKMGVSGFLWLGYPDFFYIQFRHPI